MMKLFGGAGVLVALLIGGAPAAQAAVPPPDDCVQVVSAGTSCRHPIILDH